MAKTTRAGKAATPTAVTHDADATTNPGADPTAPNPPAEAEGAVTPGVPEQSRPDASGAGGDAGAQGSGAGSGLTVVVTGPAKGRWRIGRKFGPEPIAFDLDELSEDEKAALIADPELIVVTQEAERAAD